MMTSQGGKERWRTEVFTGTENILCFQEGSQIPSESPAAEAEVSLSTAPAQTHSGKCRRAQLGEELTLPLLPGSRPS